MNIYTTKNLTTVLNNYITNSNEMAKLHQEKFKLEENPQPYNMQIAVDIASLNNQLEKLREKGLKLCEKCVKMMPEGEVRVNDNLIAGVGHYLRGVARVNGEPIRSLKGSNRLRVVQSHPQISFRTPLSTELRKLKNQSKTTEGFTETNRLNQDVDALNRRIQTIASAENIQLPVRVYDGSGYENYDEHVGRNAKTNLF